jgi:hypothetical protein
MLLLVYFSIALAAICNAIMDVISHKYDSSIFSEFNPQYWDARISWRNKYVNGQVHFGRKYILPGIKLHVAFTDAWHFFKSLMICLLILAIVSFEYTSTLESLIHFVSLGILWNVVFVLHYTKLLNNNYKFNYLTLIKK